MRIALSRIAISCAASGGGATQAGLDKHGFNHSENTQKGRTFFDGCGPASLALSGGTGGWLTYVFGADCLAQAGDLFVEDADLLS